MNTYNEQEYTKKYNEVLNLANEAAIKFKAKQISYDDYTNSVKQKIKEVGLKSVKGGLMPIAPEFIFHKEQVTKVLVKGKCPDSWTSPYYVPKGNWLYDKDNDCGKGCLCVDNGADRPSLDIINSIKDINVEQVCDGSPEHTQRPRSTPMLTLKYKSSKPINLNAMRQACRTSEKVVVDDINSPRIIDVCTNEELTEESTKQVRRKQSGSSVSFFGRGSNSKEFWEDIANASLNIEDIGMGRPSKVSNLKSKPKRSGEFNFGEEFKF